MNMHHHHRDHDEPESLLQSEMKAILNIRNKEVGRLFNKEFLSPDTV